MRIEEAIRLAQQADLDLVEVAPNSKPPVAKIMDFGKFKYETAQKIKEAKRNQSNTILKEVRFRLKIDVHDYETKRKRAEGFLKTGDKVKAMILFRGREQSRPDQGVRLLQRFAEDVSEFGTVESTPMIDGRNMVMVIGPLKTKAEVKAEHDAKKPVRAERPAGTPIAFAPGDAAISNGSPVSDAADDDLDDDDIDDDDIDDLDESTDSDDNTDSAIASDVVAAPAATPSKAAPAKAAAVKAAPSKAASVTAAPVKPAAVKVAEPAEVATEKPAEAAAEKPAETPAAKAPVKPAAKAAAAKPVATAPATPSAPGVPGPRPSPGSMPKPRAVAPKPTQAP